MAGLNTHAADLESVVEANRPLEEEPREGRPARILDECGQGPELRGLARRWSKYGEAAHEKFASSVSAARARFDVPSNEWASS